MEPAEVLRQHGLESHHNAKGELVLAKQEASDLAEYLELMYHELFKLGLCPNGSPLFREEIRHTRGR
jgi:hypothetical protein